MSAMEQFRIIEWVPGRWWLVEVTGKDGSYSPVREMARTKTGWVPLRQAKSNS